MEGCWEVRDGQIPVLTMFKLKTGDLNWEGFLLLKEVGLGPEKRVKWNWGDCFWTGLGVGWVMIGFGFLIKRSLFGLSIITRTKSVICPNMKD